MHHLPRHRLRCVVQAGEVAARGPVRLVVHHHESIARNPQNRVDAAGEESAQRRCGHPTQQGGIVGEQIIGRQMLRHQVADVSQGRIGLRSERELEGQL